MAHHSEDSTLKIPALRNADLKLEGDFRLSLVYSSYIYVFAANLFFFFNCALACCFCNSLDAPPRKNNGLSLALDMKEIQQSQILILRSRPAKRCVGVQCLLAYPGSKNILSRSPRKCEYYFFLYDPTARCEPGTPHYRGFTITLRHTTLGRTPLDE